MFLDCMDRIGSGIEKISNENWNQIYIDRTEELEKLSNLFHTLLIRKMDLFINVNNHYEGSAPLTIQKLKKWYDNDHLTS
ncbi:MAG: hypothetical protein MZV64_47695 [Ignavibacteriales bacterium]|nr:hypothetical protein [Ignavibacteriales bacterium]